MTENKHQNVYAKNIKDEEIHVSQAESGRKGYYCLGCGHEMQAVKSKLPNRIDYFRHDAKDVAIDRKCTYNDETYRHKLAKEILQRKKSIKVPNVYKYPDKKLNEVYKPNLLDKSRFINAAHVLIERAFYEDINGIIQYGHNPDIDDRFMLIKPDVCFLNEKKEPILFIEIVVTHKVSNEKKIKLKRLGIDTVQVKIPKDSPENIERSFTTTEHIKWIYNAKEERAEFVPVSQTNSKGISSIDEEQRKFFEESYECRAAQINNLIRAIGKCLESEQFGGTHGGLKSELSRIQENTRSLQSKLESRRKKVNEGIREYFKERRERVENARRELESRHKNLEERYHNKRKQLEEEEEFFDRRIENQAKETKGRREDFPRDTTENLEHRKRMETENREKIKEIRFKKERINKSIKEHRQRITQIKIDQETIPEEYRRIEEDLRNGFERDKTSESAIVAQGRARLRKQFEELRAISSKAIKNRDFKSRNRLSSDIRTIIQGWEQIRIVKKDIDAKKRYREAYDSINTGAYKDWYRPR